MYVQELLDTQALPLCCMKKWVPKVTCNSVGMGIPCEGCKEHGLACTVLYNQLLGILYTLGP